jgi:hypothetical protein
VAVSRGAAAGVFAALVWAAAEPALGRLVGVRHSDVRLLGGFVSRGRMRVPAGLAIHLANGAAFGAAFERAGLRGPARGLVAAQVENVALWPGMAVAERLVPERAELFRNPRVFVYEAVVHAVFGLVLGALLPRDRS